jgi:ornithine cyclodeaminase
MRRTLLNTMLFLSEKDVRKCISMKDSLEASRVALVSLATGEARVPTRVGVQYTAPSRPSDKATDTADWSLFKPAALDNADDNTSTKLMGMKVISIRGKNPAAGLPTTPATILTLNAETGYVDAVVAATYLTAVRTAAASALATALVRPDLKHLVVFGAGLQAECHIHAIATAIGRPIPLTTIVNRSRDRAEQLKAKLPAEWTTECKVVLLDADDPLEIAEILSTADCICTTTNANTPIFEGSSMLAPGCHINGIGSYTPDMQEVPARVVDRCHVLIDTPEARDVGDLKNIAAQHPVTLLGDALQDPEHWLAHYREGASMFDCSFYKGVGTAISDIVTADMVVKRARELGVGTNIDMTEEDE